MLNAILNLFRPKKIYLWNWVEDRWGTCTAKSPQEALQVALANQKTNRTVDTRSIRQTDQNELAYIRQAYKWFYSGDVIVDCDSK